MRWWLTMVLLLLLSCGQKTYTEEECKELTTGKAFIDRCMGGSLGGRYIGDRNCWPFSTKRLSGIVLTDGFERAAFYPNVKTVWEARKLKPAIWPENSPNVQLPSQLQTAKNLTPHAFLIEAEGQMSQCDAWFGHQGEYSREFIISKYISAAELPLSRR